MENGKNFVPPILTKRDQNYPRLRFHCAKCDDRVDGYILADGVLNVFCHGAGLRMQIGDASGLEAAREGGKGEPMVVFLSSPPSPFENALEAVRALNPSLIDPING